LNRELLAGDDSANAPMGHPGTALPITCSDDVMALLLDDFKTAIGGGGKLLELKSGAPSAADRKQLLQSAELPNLPPSGDVLGDHQWHQPTPKLRGDGSLAEDLPTIHMQLSPNGGGMFDSQQNMTLVPEPASMVTMLTIAGVVLCSRRRRKCGL
jgi:hypothetical protein